MPIPSPDFGGIKTGLFHERVLADSGTVLPNVAPPIIDKLQKLGVYPPALLYVPGGLNEAVAYSQLPTSSDGDFTVSRNTTTAGETGFATCVNQDGYYQNYLPDYPTIDYSNNGVPALLTQPQRVQLVTRPLSFGHSDWTKSGATIEGDPSTAGVELVTNGTFTGGTTGWTLGGTTAYGTNNIVITGDGSGSNYIQQTALWAANSKDDNLLLVSYEITQNSLVGAGILQIGNTSSNEFMVATTIDNTVGSHSFYIQPNGTGTNNQIGLILSSGFTSGTITIDNISVTEVQPYEAPMLEPDLGSELVTAWTNKDFDNFASTGVGITQMVSGASGDNCYSLATIADATNYKLEFTSTQTIGCDFLLGTTDEITGGQNVHTVVSGLNVVYFTSDAAYTYCGFNSTASFTDTQITGFLLSEILATATTPMTESYLMTATGADGYIELASALTITNAKDHANSICVKRITGTGNISISDCNNDWTVVSDGTALVDGWYSYDVTSESNSTSGQIGLKLATSGDAVRIFFAQLEEGSYPTTPIWTGSEGATVTRVKDEVSLTDLITNNILTSTIGIIDNTIDATRWTYKYIGSNIINLYKDGIYAGVLPDPPPTTINIENGETEQIQMYNTNVSNTLLQLSSEATIDYSTAQGLSWDSSDDTYARLGSISAIATSTSALDANLPIQAEMKRCLLNDDGTVNYYVDATDPIMKSGTSATTSGTTDGTTANKLVDSGADFVTDGIVAGQFVHNTTDDTYSIITAIDDLHTLSLERDVIVSGEAYDVGTANFGGTDGQVMVEIPKFWYKESLVGTVKSWYISLTYISGFELHPAFWKDGKQVDYRYMSAFEGGMWDASTGAMCAKASIHTSLYAAGDKMCSVAGQWAKTNETRTEYRAMAAERGTGFRQ